MYILETVAESLVPHPDVRHLCLEILADSISTAHAYRRWGWVSVHRVNNGCIAS